MARDNPVAGSWYRDDHGQVFEVLIVRGDEGLVELQYQDGTLGQCNLATWAAIQPVPLGVPDPAQVYELPDGALDEDTIDLAPDDETLHPEEESWPSASEEDDKT
jgi:hypothetical protein